MLMSASILTSEGIVGLVSRPLMKNSL